MSGPFRLSKSNVSFFFHPVPDQLLQHFRYRIATILLSSYGESLCIGSKQLVGKEIVRLERARSRFRGTC